MEVNLQKEVKYWNNHANLAEKAEINAKTELAHDLHVDDKYCAVLQLTPENCRKYYNYLEEKYPQLARILAPWFSPHFRKKESKSTTNLQWLDAQGFYKALIADMYLKSKNRKFTCFLVPNYSWYCKVANSAENVVTKARDFGGLQFALWASSNPIKKRKLVVL
jgi:hypothetical protein